MCRAVAAFISTPGDIVSIQIMAGLDKEEVCVEGDASKPGGQSDSRSSRAALITASSKETAMAVARRMYNEGGVSAFFDGARERVLYWSVAISIFLSVYCSLRRFALDII